MDGEFQGLNLIELLDLLEPVPDPSPPSMWPETTGWIWLGVILAGLVTLAMRRYRARRRATAYRRAALAELAAVGTDPAAISGILRRTALAAYPRRRVAPLDGEDWLSFLDETGGCTGFREGPGRALIEIPYSGRSSPGSDALERLAAGWVRRHRRESAG